MQNYLPNIEDINALQSASSLKTISESAIEKLDEIAAAQSINSATDTGETKVLWQRPMSEELKTTLEGLGCKVTELDRVAIPGRLFEISWG